MLRMDYKKDTVIVLTPENLVRMKQGDPVTVDINGQNLTLCIEEMGEDKLVKILEKDGMSYLTRGMSYHPDDGQPPIQVGQLGGEIEG